MVFMILQIPLTFLGVVLSCDTWVDNKSYFSMDNPFLLASLTASNQIYLIISQALPPQAFLARPILYICISIALFIYLVIDLPFYYRVVNSIYGGFLLSRLGVGASSLMAVLGNPTKSDDIGLSTLFGLGFGSIILFFIIGFTAVEIYTQIIFRMVRNRLTSLKREPNAIHSTVSEITNERNLNLYLRFSVKGKEDELIQHFLKFAMNQRLDLDVNNLVSCALYIFYRIDDQNSSSYALHLISKATKKNSNLLTRYSIYQRTKEIESLASSGKNSFELRHILETVEKQQESLRQYQKLFWKHFVSNEENEEKVYNLVKMMHRFMEEASTTFNNLLVNFHNNAHVLRSYAKFMEEFMFETELAEEFYTEANILEEEDSKKKRFTMATKKNSKKRGINSNRVLPISTNSEDDNKLNSFAMDPRLEENDVENLESASQMGDTKKDKQTMYRSAINKPPEGKLRFLFLQSLGFISVLVIMVILGTNLGLSNDGSKILTVNQFCDVSPVPYMLLSGVRYIHLLITMKNNGYLNETLFESEYHNHKKRVHNIITILEKVDTIINGGKFPKDMMRIYVTTNKVENIPILQSGNSTAMISNIQNSSISDMEKEMQSITQKVYDWGLDDYMNNFQNYEFLYLWTNRLSLTSYFEEFCSLLIDDSNQLLADENQIFIFTLIGIFILYIAFIASYFVFAFFHLSYLHNITKLFSKIPKDIVGTVFHALEQKSEDKIVKINNSLFTPKRMIVGLVIVIFFITVTASSLLLYESLTIMNTFSETMTKVKYGTTVLQTSMREKFKLGELVLHDSEQLGIDLSVFHREILKHSEDLTQGWLNYRYGTKENNFIGLSGVSSAIDSLLTSDNCTSRNNVSCFGLDQLFDSFTLMADRFNEEAYRVTFPLEILSTVFIDLFGVSSELSSKMYSVLSLYVQSQRNPTRLVSPIVTSVAVVLLLLLSYILYVEAKRFEKENHQLRRMFNFISYEVLEQVEEIKSFILYYSISNGKKKMKGEKFSKTKAILGKCKSTRVVMFRRCCCRWSHCS